MWRIAFPLKGLLKTAIRSDDPVVFMEHRGLLSMKGPVLDADADEIIPCGSASIRRAGSDVTIVGIAHMVTKALAAAVVVRCAIHRVVEAHILIGHLLLGEWLVRAHAPEFVKDRVHHAKVSLGPVTSCAGHGQPIECQPQAIHLLQVRSRHACDHCAPVAAQDDQALLLELQQRLTHRSRLTSCRAASSTLRRCSPGAKSPLKMASRSCERIDAASGPPAASDMRDGRYQLVLAHDGLYCGAGRRERLPAQRSLGLYQPRYRRMACTRAAGSARERRIGAAEERGDGRFADFSQTAQCARPMRLCTVQGIFIGGRDFFVGSQSR
jgi:hypothetical protein